MSQEPQAIGILVFVLLLAGCGSPGPAVKVPSSPVDLASAQPDFAMDATAWYLE